MLEFIAERLGALVDSTWIADETAKGERVKLYRDYTLGNHRAEITNQMRQMLRISDSNARQFNVNYCDLIVAKMADRLSLTAVKGDTDAATAWAADVLRANRIDGIQDDVHTACLRDGITYVMVAYDSDSSMVGKPNAIYLAHELAFDGDVGLIGVFDRTRRYLVAAAKIWYEGPNQQRRVNLYFPDRIEKYIYGSSGAASFGDAEPIPWTDNGQPIGVPVVVFANRVQTSVANGISEIASAIPLQDALNRTLVSMVMTAELTAFPIRYASFVPPAEITPGMWLHPSADFTKDMLFEIGVLGQGELVPYISEGDWIIDQMSEMTSTPLSKRGSDAASGESLKQREIGLLGKSRRFQVKSGNSWEDVMSLAARLESIFGRSSVYATARWTAEWQEAAIRNDAEVVANAKALLDNGMIRQWARAVAPVYGWDDQMIEQVIAERQAAQSQALIDALNSNPAFGNFNGVG